MKKSYKYKKEIAGRKLIIETGRLAKQADASVLVQYGETMVLTTVVYSKKEMPFLGFFPLTVDYREMSYAAGKIPGGFFKREGKPKEKEILVSRLIDRPIRPLFPKTFNREVQVISYLLSSDLENEGDILGIIGASTALYISEIPYTKPIAGVRIGLINNKLILNPTFSEMKNSTLELIVAGDENNVIMMEGEAKEVEDSIIPEAVSFALESMKPIIELQREIYEDFKPEKLKTPEHLLDKEIYKNIEEKVKDKIIEIENISEKRKRSRKREEFIEQIAKLYGENLDEAENIVRYVTEEVVKNYMREKIIKEGIRLDGRKEDEIRPIMCEIGVLPRTHGSAVFTRGETQALVITTLGTKTDEQFIEDIMKEEFKSFMLHYNFPSFSTGDIKPLRSPSRREIGHGHLAERSLQPVVPDENNFPYTIRVVSDILESNGSSSMATVCGASLSLMDAGVPIKASVAGVALGLVKEGEDYKILTDILGAEDHYGDMDFKLAGTEKGFTGIQLDLKVAGISIDIIKKIIERAKKGRMYILSKMKDIIPQPRKNLSKYAPRILSLSISRNKIGELIGPGGRNIRKITETTGTKIEIDDNEGKVLISGENDNTVIKAKEMVERHTKEVKLGEIYEGKITRVTSFGVFVELFPGKEGLVHISKLSKKRIRNIEELFKPGDVIVVKVINIDENGRINLSKKKEKDE